MTRSTPISTNADSMYFLQAVKEPDKKNFDEIIDKEFRGHMKEGNYKP
jgi:hypothetical protein